jgi:hypothetical protein
MRKWIGLFMITMLIALVAGCVEVSELEYIEFETYPKTTYLVGEELEDFEITYKLKGEGEVPETLAFDDEMVIITGFSTAVVGTFTMTVSLEGYDDASINFVYTVVNSMIDTMFAGGYGTEESPYLIETAQQLSNIRVFDGSEYTYFKLINDIDLEGFDWLPIGTMSFEIDPETGYERVTVVGGFHGDFDGNNKAITNYTVTGDVTEQNGAIALFQGSISDGEESRIYDLSITDVNIDASNVASYRAGVLFGSAYNISIENVTITGNVTITNTDRVTFGVFGSLGKNVTFDGCESNVTVTTKGAFQMYGFSGYIGWLLNGKTGGDFALIDSVNRTELISLESTTNRYTGSMIGITYSGGTITLTNTNNLQDVLVAGQTPFTETIMVTSYTGDTSGALNDADEVNSFIGYVSYEAGQMPDLFEDRLVVTITNSAIYLAE